MSTAAAQNPDYLASLGLQRAPFLDQIDDRFFYADPQLVQRLDLLQHLIQFGDMLLGICGPAGSGKSTLMQQLLRRGATIWRSCPLNGGQIQQPADLLTQLADTFGLDRSAAPERLKADLVRLFQTLRHSSQVPVIAIDDAHLLPDPALKTLLELGGEPRETLKLLRVVLFSDPGLERRLIQASWHSPLQPLLHNLDLQRFDDQQTAAYLMYRLAVAGYSGESPFSLTEIRALHKAADGLPGRLNVLAHEMLVERAGRIAARKSGQAARSAVAMPRWPALVMGAATVLFLGGLGWFLTHTPSDAPENLQLAAESEPQPAQDLEPSGSPETSAVQAPEAPPETDTQPVTPTTTEQEPPAATEAVAEVTLPAPVATAAAPEPQPPADGPAATTADAESQAVPAETAPSANATTTPAPAEAAPANAPAPAANTTDLPAAPATAIPAPEKPATTGTSVPAASAPAETPAAVDTGAAPQTDPESSAQALPAPAPSAAPAPSEPAPEKPAPSAKASEQLGTEWLQSRPGAHFTLQLLGGRSESSLRDFLRQHRIPEPVATFHTIHKGDDWYVLVHGEFPSMDAARAAAAKLPATVRRGKPWARSFASVHADMQKVQP